MPLGDKYHSSYLVFFQFTSTILLFNPSIYKHLFSCVMKRQCSICQPQVELVLDLEGYPELCKLDIPMNGLFCCSTTSGGQLSIICTLDIINSLTIS